MEKVKGWMHKGDIQNHLLAVEPNIRRDTFEEVAVIPQDAIRLEAVVEHYVHRGGVKMGRLPVQDYLPADWIDGTVDIIVMRRKG